MSSLNSYKELALLDYKGAIALKELSLYNLSAKLYQQFVEKSLKHIIDCNQLNSKPEDKQLLKTHNVLKLGLRVEEIINQKYDKNTLAWFRTVKDYYFEVSYPGDDFTEITESMILELADWVESFKSLVQQQQQLQQQ